jgi:hypothetical protein
MANTPRVTPRVPPELIEAARAGADAPDVSVTVLMRAGLLVLAGLGVREALKAAETRRGPKPRARAAA